VRRDDRWAALVILALGLTCLVLAVEVFRLHEEVLDLCTQVTRWHGTC